jgi:hypothetical protein
MGNFEDIGGSDFDTPTARIKPTDLNDNNDLLASWGKVAGSIFNDTAQNLFNADYIGFDSKLNVTGEPNLKNVVYSTFKTDDADVNYGFVYDSTNDYYYTPDLSAVNEYVIVEATSLSSPINQNNVKSTQISAGKWLVYCDTGTDAVHRAQIMKTLFYGQKILNFTSVTAIKTSHANDVGKQAHLISRPYTGGQPITRTIDGTFLDTTNNTDCSSWSDLLGGSDGYDTKIWQIPTGTTRNSSSTSASLELGTDTSADENENPANCRIDCTGDSPNAYHYFHVLILCVGDITWSGNVDETIIDYFTDESIPLFTIADTLENEGVLDYILIFKDTAGESVTNCIPVINSTIDASSSEQISVSADGGSNWTDVNNAEIARPTAGTALWRRIVITRTDLSVEDKVTEQAIKYNLY